MILAFPLFARDITVTVLDIDIEIPMEGSVIRSWDGSEHTCDEDGKAVIQVPDDRQVTIYASYPGYDTGRIVIPVTGEYFTISIGLSDIFYGKEMIVEASRPGVTESRPGRSVAVSEKEISQTAEIGIIEDVMSTIKLLPGVNYSGFFDAMPSIRGGFPGDMMASLDGFYINNPYHWGGGFSIFDPRMVQSAQLSHGVFSGRFGNTISGLLDIATKKPSPDNIEYDFGANMSAANFNISFPISGKGGILFLGRITYYDPFIALAKLLAKKIKRIEIVNSIEKAPYIRSGAVTGNYRFTDNLELAATGFWGMDGIGVNYLNSNRTSGLNSDSSLEFDFANYQGFLTASLLWNPKSDMLLKFSTGTGYEKQTIDGTITYNIHNKEFSDTFKINFPDLTNSISANYQYHEEGLIKQSDFTYNAQGRADFDWEISEHLIFAAGIQEMFNLYKSSGDQEMTDEIWFGYLDAAEQQLIKFMYSPMLNPNPIPWNSNIWETLRISVPINFSPSSKNKLFSTSSYILAEYSTNDNRLQTELGLRVDHFLLLADDFKLQSNPVVNPRVNVDYNIFKNISIIKSFDLSAGTGLFSSVNSVVFMAEKRFNIEKMKPNRSWTSILGLKFDFPKELRFTIEGYYKYVFDRMYIPVRYGTGDLDIKPRFDGTGRIWGVDLMLQRKESDYIDGWLTYSWNWTKYKDPLGEYGTMGISGGDRGSDWYYPSFHRFHNLNLVMNIKPFQKINFYLRFGLASGVIFSKRVGDAPESYPVLIYDKDIPSESYFIEKYYWPSVRDESNRTTPSLPMDLKMTIFGTTKKRNMKYEVYVAVENVLSLLYTSQGNTRFNHYTGQIDTGSTSASYDIPIPIPSFGFKIRY